MEYQVQIYEKEGPVARVTFNRPEVRNATDLYFYRELMDALQDAEGDPNIRVVVLTGAGTAFSAGRHLRFTNTATPEEREEYSRINSATQDYLMRMAKPVVARVNGYAAGGACELVARCDISIASTDARLALREINTGVVSGPAFLPWVGRARAMEMSLTGRWISAEEAAQWGLITKAVPPEKLDETVQEYVDMLLNLPPLGIAGTKRSFYVYMNLGGYNASREYNSQLNRAILPTRDRDEAERAFLEKRKATFTGR